MKSNNTSAKLKSYSFILGGVFFGFLLGVYFALPALKGKPTPIQKESPPIKEQPQGRPSEPPIKEISQFKENILKETFMGESLTVKWIPREEFLRVYQNADILSLDIRTPAEYKAGHIKGAKLLPFEEIDNYHATLPDEKKIILYANDSSFESVKNAYKKLLDYGRNDVFLLDVTYDQWKEGGNPVETGNPFEE